MYYRYINYITSISKYIIYIFIKINKSKYKIYKSKYIKGHRSRQISKFETSQGYTERLCCVCVEGEGSWEYILSSSALIYQRLCPGLITNTWEKKKERKPLCAPRKNGSALHKTLE